MHSRTTPAYFKGMSMTRRLTDSKLHAWILCLALGVTGTLAYAGMDEDIAQANALMQQRRLDAALPIYERLAAADPSNTVVAERHAFCLYALMEVQPAGKEREALIVRARREVERAMG